MTVTATTTTINTVGRERVSGGKVREARKAFRDRLWQACYCGPIHDGVQCPSPSRASMKLLSPSLSPTSCCEQEQARGNSASQLIWRENHLNPARLVRTSRRNAMGVPCCGQRTHVFETSQKNCQAQAVRAKARRQRARRPQNEQAQPASCKAIPGGFESYGYNHAKMKAVPEVERGFLLARTQVSFGLIEFLLRFCRPRSRHITKSKRTTYKLLRN